MTPCDDLLNHGVREAVRDAASRYDQAVQEARAAATRDVADTLHVSEDVAARLLSKQRMGEL